LFGLVFFFKQSFLKKKKKKKKTKNCSYIYSAHLSQLNP
jgi:hypothetical protein